MNFLPDRDRSAHAALPAVSEGARRLQFLPDCVGMETELARCPLFAAASPDSDQFALPGPVDVGSLNRHPFVITACAGWPTMRDLLVLCELIDRFVKQGCPDDCLVAVTATDLCEAAYPSKGGWQFERACESLMRLRSLTVRYVAPLPDGTSRTWVWGPIDAGWVDSGSRGRGCVRLSPELAGLVREGRLVYLDREILHTLYARDPYAARLWTFLESETFNRPFKYRLFSAPEGEPRADGHVPAIADLLWLSGWSRRRKVKERVEKAARVVNAVDASYRLSVKPAVQPHMWNLCVKKKSDSRSSGT